MWATPHTHGPAAVQDIVCRYAHQTGHYVERRFGWDCHGLPVEFEIDKALGISGKEDARTLVEKSGPCSACQRERQRRLSRPNCAPRPAGA